VSCPGTPAGAAASAPAATPFDGTYRMEVSEQVWRRSDPEKHPENWGGFVFVFGHGRFAETQENRAACTWAYGTYQVDGQSVGWRYADGGGIAPTHAQNKSGEEFTFRWSRYRDTMTLVAVSPPDIRMEPWHRVSATPSAALLSKRCPPPAQAIAW